MSLIHQRASSRGTWRPVDRTRPSLAIAPYPGDSSERWCRSMCWRKGLRLKDPGLTAASSRSCCKVGCVSVGNSQELLRRPLGPAAILFRHRLHMKIRHTDGDPHHGCPPGAASIAMLFNRGPREPYWSPTFGSLDQSLRQCRPGVSGRDWVATACLPQLIAPDRTGPNGT